MDRIEQNEQFIGPDGETYGTGLWVPGDDDLLDVPTFSQKFTSRMDKQDIIEIISDTRRMMARIRFPSERWIKNQAQSSSCNGYACAGTLGRARVINGQPEVHLSGEFVYAGINGGRDRGSLLSDGFKWLESNGACPEEMVPHMEYRWSRISQEARDAAKRFRGLKLVSAPSELELAAGIAAGFTAVVAVHFGNRMQQLDSAGVAGHERGRGNHSVGVDDLRYRNGRFEFDFFNSHGLRYGQKGKAWLTWDNHFATTSKYHQFFLVRAVIDDPADNFGPPKPTSLA